MRRRRTQKRLQVTDSSHPGLKHLVREAARLSLDDAAEPELERALRQLVEAQLVARRDHDLRYPPDPPHDSCRHAVLTGVLVENGSLPQAGDFRYMFTFGLERIAVWTPQRDEYSVLVAEPDLKVKSLPLWKTLRSAIRASQALLSSLETIVDPEYQWIYRFNPKLPPPDQEWLEADGAALDIASGLVLRIRDIAKAAPILELLHRDDRFYTAVQNVVAAAENHSFCQVCAFQPLERRTHHDHEPPIWDFASAFPRMEIAIVQSARAVEAILGKPGNRSDGAKLARVHSRWKQAIDLDPTESFSLVGRSYLDFYYALFEARGAAAHSLGALPFSVSRELTIQAQSFAWQIVLAYYQKHHAPDNVAAQRLKLDQNVVESEPEEWTTRLTAESRSCLPWARISPSALAQPRRGAKGRKTSKRVRSKS